MSMEETKQLTPEELKSVKDLQTQYNKCVFELGSIEAQLQNVIATKEAIETEKNNILSDLKTLGERERELMNTLQTNYGTGSINAETGEVTPL
jgi:flagellar biosynthesis chaperone FliJ